MAGRFFWSTASDYVGRKNTCFIFLTLGAVLYFILPRTGADHLNSVVLFVCISVVLLSMYGGGFATIPAYLRDLFGTHHVSAIHGRLLTAWSVAGVARPVLVNNMREYQLEHGADRASAYQSVLHVMAGLLVVGFIANLLVRPAARNIGFQKAIQNLLPKMQETLNNLDTDLRRGATKMAENTKKSSTTMILLAWLLVGVPLGWGVYNTLLSSMKLFQNAPATSIQQPAP